MDAAADLAHRLNMKVHVDGARLGNAAVALKVTPARVVEHADRCAFGVYILQMARVLPVNPRADEGNTDKLLFLQCHDVSVKGLGCTCGLSVGRQR